MPQILKNVMPGAAIMIANDERFQRTLDRNPEIGFRAMRVISSWSLVECFMMDAYVRLLGGPSAKAAEDFANLRSAKAKREAIADLRSKVPHQLHQHFDQILRDLSAAQSFRDKLSHWVWAFSPHLKDHLLIIDPREFVLKGANSSNTYCIDAAELDRQHQEYLRISREGPSCVKPRGWPTMTAQHIPKDYPPFRFDHNGDVVFD